MTYRRSGSHRFLARAAPPPRQKAFALRLPSAYLKFKREFENGSAMTRPSEVTRERIMKAAERLFAEHGYDGTSIRAIVAKARVNQAAINYHFAGKDGLYREVLHMAFHALTEQQLSHADEVKALSREAALAEFIRRQLRPLMTRDELSRYMRIFNWETVRPTAVFRSLLSEEAAPFMGLAVEIVRRFLPSADHRTLTVAAIWMLGQCSVFLRNREQLTEPPTNLTLDESSFEWLSHLITGWIVGGLGRH
jgi:TetR/AcrR family transcriptional regulator, regulator of cefoperazone and chloramphenicol sensitivity